MRLIARGEEYLSCAMAAKAQENDIKYYYQLSRFFNIVDQLRKEIMISDNIDENLQKAAEEIIAIVE